MMVLVDGLDVVGWGIYSWSMQVVLGCCMVLLSSAALPTQVEERFLPPGPKFFSVAQLLQPPEAAGLGQLHHLFQRKQGWVKSVYQKQTCCQVKLGPRHVGRLYIDVQPGFAKWHLLEISVPLLPMWGSVGVGSNGETSATSILMEDPTPEPAPRMPKAVVTRSEWLLGDVEPCGTWLGFLVKIN